MISVSKSQSTQGHHHTHFETAEPIGPDALCEIITTKVWSPIVWTDGLRRKANFLSAYIAAFDFDSGRWTMEDAHNFVQELGLVHLIAPTKSHQLQKMTRTGSISPPCDRFRLIIPFAHIITSLEVYEYNMKTFGSLMPCDMSCKDGARFFYPCTGVHGRWSEGELLQILEVPAEETLDAQRKRYEERLALYKNSGTLPSWITGAFRHGVPEGERHKTCYRIGAFLTRLGYDLEKIIASCMRSPLAAIGEADVRRAVANGIQRAMGELR